MVCEPETSRVVTELEKHFLQKLKETHYHHDEETSFQVKFRNKTNNLIKSIREFGNPFNENYKELIVMDSRNCADESVIAPLRDIESMGNKQYKQFCEDVFIRVKSIYDPIKCNSVTIVSKPKPKKTTTSNQIQMSKNDVSHFGRLFIANQ